MPNKVKQQEESPIIFTAPANFGNGIFPSGAAFVKFRPGIIQGPAPVYISSVTNSTGSSSQTSLGATNPGALNGDCLLAGLGLDNAGQTGIVPPNGWTQYAVASGTRQLQTYVKIANNEPATWTWNWGKSCVAIVEVGIYRPVNQTIIIQAATPLTTSTPGGASNGLSTPAGSGLNFNSTLVFFGITGSPNSSPITPSGTMIARESGVCLSMSSFMGDDSVKNAIPFEMALGNAGFNSTWITQSFVLQPAGTTGVQVGYVSDGYDLGPAPRTNLFEWRARVGFNNSPNQFTECGMYLLLSGSDNTTALGSGDAPLPANYLPVNLQGVGSVAYDGSSPMLVSGRIRIQDRQVATVWEMFGPGGLDSSINPYFMLIPIPDEIEE